MHQPDNHKGDTMIAEPMLHEVIVNRFNESYHESGGGDYGTDQTTYYLLTYFRHDHKVARYNDFKSLSAVQVCDILEKCKDQLECKDGDWRVRYNPECDEFAHSP